MQRTEYITKKIADQTKYKSLVDACQRNAVSIVKLDDRVFYLECSNLPNKTFDIAIRETKRIFPELKYIGEIPTLPQVREEARKTAKRTGYNQVIIKGKGEYGGYSFSRKYDGCCPEWYGEIIEEITA